MPVRSSSKVLGADAVGRATGARLSEAAGKAVGVGVGVTFGVGVGVRAGCAEVTLRSRWFVVPCALAFVNPARLIVTSRRRDINDDIRFLLFMISVYTIAEN
jgi:hypothetical protein